MRIVKIGISTNASKRIGGIQTSCPFKIDKTWVSEDTEYFREIEAHLHEHYRPVRSHGEWFNIGFEEAVEKTIFVLSNWEKLKKQKQIPKETHEITNEEHTSSYFDDIRRRYMRTQRSIEMYTTKMEEIKARYIGISEILMNDADRFRLENITNNIRRLNRKKCDLIDEYRLFTRIGIYDDWKVEEMIINGYPCTD